MEDHSIPPHEESNLTLKGTQKMASHLDTGNLVKFLASLRKNNNKEWFETHRSEFDRLRSQFLDLLGEVISASSASFAPEIEDVDPKKCMFRIFRDTRFSSDKSPYKTNFGALLPVTKSKEVRAGYYIHIGADNRLMAGACVHPLPPAELAKARYYIAEHYEELHTVVARAKRSGFTDLDGEKQKKVPRGFSPDHPASEYLRFKSFKILAIEPATSANKNLGRHVVEVLRRSHPFADFIRRTLG